MKMFRNIASFVLLVRGYGTRGRDLLVALSLCTNQGGYTTRGTNEKLIWPLSLKREFGIHVILCMCVMGVA